METYEGIVAEVNVPLLYFRFTDGAYVNVAISMAKNCKDDFSATLPAIGEKVRCERLHRCRQLLNGSSVFVVCKKYFAKFSSAAIEGARFLWILQDERLGISDTFELMKNNEKLLEKYENISYIMLDYLDTIAGKFSAINNEISCCEFGNLPELIFSTISSLKTLNFTGNEAKYSALSVYPKHEWEVLIGFFYLNPVTGTCFFKDKLREIRCIFSKCDNDTMDLYKYLDHTLRIRNFRIINELYDNEIILSYLYFETKFVDIFREKARKPEEIPSHFLTSVRFHVLKKSHMCYSNDAGLHFWLLVQLKMTGERGFLRFSSNFAYEFRPSNEYTVHFHGQLSRICEAAHAALAKNIPQYAIPSRVIIKTEKQWDNPRTVSMLTKSNAGKRSSFRAVLIRRLFGKKLRESENPGFGLIDRNQSLEFEMRGSPNILTLTFQNWENIETPLGLVKNALVEVRNADFLDRGYCVTTPMTTFEVVKIP